MDRERLRSKPFLQQVRSIVETANALIVIVTALAGVGSVIIVTGVKYFNVSSRGVIASATGLLILLLVASLGWFYVAYIYDPRFYELLSLEGTLVIEPSGMHRRYHYERRQRVRALRDDLRLIEMRAHWTGKSSEGVTTLAPLFRSQAILDGRVPEENGHVHRWVYLRRPLRRGEEINTGVRQIHEDDVELQMPYYREGGGSYRLRDLTVQVSFPIAHDVHGVEGVVWNSNRSIRHHIAGTVEPVRTVNQDRGTVDYTVRVHRPRRFHSYGVRWHWSDTPSQ